MTKKLRQKIHIIILGSIIYLIAILANVFLNINNYIILLAFLTAYFIIGGNVVKTAVQNIFRGQVFDENFLMTIATVGAFIIGDYAEAVAVMLFYQVGECFQSFAVGKSRRSIAALMDIRPDFAHLKKGEEFIRVEPSDVRVGETIMVKPGEKIPLDGTVLSGASFIDTAALTGESIPREAAGGDKVISGCISLSGVIYIKVEKTYGESTVAKILELVENAVSRKAKTEQFITKFARIYTPLVVLAAFLLAVIPPLFVGDFTTWLYRALTFLVISCPCALVISIPLGFFGGLGSAGRAGILIKGSNYLEALRNVQVIVFDKTGTLTKGNFKVTKITPTDSVSDAELLELAAYAECFSLHPISASLKSAYQREIETSRLSDTCEIAGHGVTVMLDGKKVFVGNEKLMRKFGIDYNFEAIDHDGQQGTVIHIACDNQYYGNILIADEIKADAAIAVAKLKSIGLSPIMLTGDNKKVAGYVANELGIDNFYAELLPNQKVEIVEELLSTQPTKGKVAFVGDGINDAPVLARADIGIAMGGLGSDAAIEAADVVIMNDEPQKICEAIKISKRTIKIVRENIVFSLGVKIIVLALAALGFASMWAAIFADVGVAFLAILNSTRDNIFAVRDRS